MAGSTRRAWIVRSAGHEALLDTLGCPGISEGDAVMARAGRSPSAAATRGERRVTVLNKYRCRTPPGAVNIMRGGAWGNPFVIGKDGGRAEVIEKYRRWLWARIKADKAFAARVRALHGKDLVCCCAPAACHGDVLERAAAWLHDQP